VWRDEIGCKKALPYTKYFLFPLKDTDYQPVKHKTYKYVFIPVPDWICITFYTSVIAAEQPRLENI